MEIKPTPFDLQKDLEFLANTPNLKKDEALSIVKKFYHLFQIKSSVNYGSKYSSSYGYPYGPTKIDTLSFEALEANCKLIPQLFKSMARFVINYEKTNKQKNLSEKYNSGVFLRDDIAYIMCLMGLNLTNPHHYQYQIIDIKVYNFSHIFSKQQQKTASLIKYFQLLFYQKLNLRSKLYIQRLAKHGFLIDSFEFKSKYMDYGIELDPDYPLKKSIDEYDYPKIDFANKYIGGGALTRGFLQEQTLFHTHPQLYTTIVLCKPIKDNEALRFVGFNKITDMFKEETIIAMDALNYSKNPKSQFQSDKIDRQIAKAYVGFSSEKNSHRIVTGNWGCGAYHGNLQLKYMIQWIAAALAGKRLIYCSYGTPKQKLMLPKDIFHKIKSMEVQQVYRMLLWAAKEKYYNDQDLYTLMKLYDDPTKKQERKPPTHHNIGVQYGFDKKNDNWRQKDQEKIQNYPNVGKLEVERQIRKDRESNVEPDVYSKRSHTVAKMPNNPNNNQNYLNKIEAAKKTLMADSKNGKNSSFNSHTFVNYGHNCKNYAGNQQPPSNQNMRFYRQ